MLMIDWREMSWWYWLATVILLCLGMAGWDGGYPGAMALTGIQIVHFALREGSVTAFPVQVRIGYLLLLLVAYPKPMQWLYWVPIIGTWAQLTVGYCTMARLVSLLPWNRREPLSARRLLRTFFSAPVRGSVLQQDVAKDPSVNDSN